MIETWELRVAEKHAHLILDKDEGKLLSSGLVRRIVIRSDDPRIQKIAQVQAELRARRDYLYSTWLIHRKYTAEELAEATLLQLIPTCFFEPAGEECGTVYDEQPSCPACGAGRKQVSDLELNTARIPKRADVAVTIANEWVFSSRLRDAAEEAGMTGIKYAPVRHHGRGQSGVSSSWVQPQIASAPIQIVDPTRIGDTDSLLEMHDTGCRCPSGHVLGLKVISEVYVRASSWDGKDMVQSEQLIGTRRGLLVPAPLTIVSQAFYGLLSKEKMRGFKVEVVHPI